MTSGANEDSPDAAVSVEVARKGPAGPDPEKSWLEVALSIFATVRAGEGLTVLLLALNLFLLLCAYYIVKPVRDQLIIDVPGGAELKSYASGASAVALLLVTPLYGALVDRMKRNRLIIGVTCFFVGCLVAFGAALGLDIAPTVLAVAFYLWVSVFSMMVVAQLWAFANDVYTEEQGKRLFAIVGIGASLGAVFGGLIVAALADVSVLVLLLLAAVILLCTAGITQWIHVREAHRAPRAPGVSHPSDAPETGDNALRLVLRHRYLVLLAAFTLLFTLVNSNGEYMVSKLVKDHYHGAQIREFYAEFYSWVNLLGLAIQSLFVSRVVAKLGLERAFFVFPVLVLFTSATLGMWPILGVIALTKKAENSTD